MKKILTLILTFFPAFLFAAELNVTVTDKDLEFPLEGAKITLEKNKEIEAFADGDGNATLQLPDGISEGSVTATLPGYRPVSVKFSGTENPLLIEMSISSVIEGKELVVNRSSPDSKEEKTGVSTVITKEEMHTTANVGLVEDCMASVRTLPGVSFSGAWGSEPSVRGGEPRELACLLDGMYTVFPYHWGGGNSIFNPSMVESIKLSNGVFSAKYGRASSGILEAKTLKPDYENVHVNASLSTTCADAFVQLPFGKNVGGMIFGTHLTYLDPLVLACKKGGVSSLDMIERAPYIRDFFLKTDFTPSPEFDVSFVGFLGSDGLGIDQTEEEKNIKTHAVFDYDIYQALGGINLKYLASDSLLFHGLISYNGMFEDLEMKVTESGSVKYNDEFVSKYGSVYSGVKSGASYTLPNLESENGEKIKSHLVTGRLETEIELTEKNHLCFGVDETFQTSKTEEIFDGWSDLETPEGYLFNKVSYRSETNGNCIFDHSAFLSWTYGNDNDFFQSEAGLRGEFISLKNFEDDFTVNFIPDLCPRANVTITPWQNIGILEKVSLTAGSGLFVSIPRETMIFTKDMGLENFNIRPNRAILGVVGGDIALEGGLKFKCEAYYKHYLSRIYAYEVTDASSNYKDIDIFAKSNGKGHVFGIDSMIEKKAGEKWDGYISYSFIYSRFKNPAGIKKEECSQSMYGSPLDEWYFPSYHRFHTLNLVGNWHFGKGWTFTVKGTVASGAPKDKTGDVTSYAAKMDDGTVVQRYTRSSVYSDTLRTTISCPIDFRIAYSWKTNNDKASWEFYFALQDAFVNLYSPKGDKSFNRYTGEMSDVAESADFNLGIPIPSLGVKVKF